jgi:hypothetical protein
MFAKLYVLRPGSVLVAILAGMKYERVPGIFELRPVEFFANLLHLFLQLTCKGILFPSKIGFVNFLLMGVQCLWVQVAVG